MTGSAMHDDGNAPPKPKSNANNPSPKGSSSTGTQPGADGLSHLSRDRDEFELIHMIETHIPSASERVLLGIGDDAAIVAPTQHPLLLCTDAMAEGVHFDLAYASSTDIGHKALASCLSDIAAMNGKPLYALFSLALPTCDAATFLDGFYAGAGTLAQRFGVDIVGGDLSASKGGRFIDVTCVGEAANPRTRAGVKPGDWIAVSGHPGASAAGLEVLQNPELRSPLTADLVRAHLRPVPRFDLLAAFENAPQLCSAMIDISDGLSSELHHLAARSGVSIEIEESQLPYHPAVLGLSARLAAPEKPLAWALSGGEDYELLIALDERELDRLGSPPPGFTLIGRAHALAPDEPQTQSHRQPSFQSQPQVRLRHSDGHVSLLARTGFNHFAAKPSSRD